MHYATIKWTDIANGEGVRISLFVSGCTHRCKNCFNEVAWDFSYGQPFDEEIQSKIINELGYECMFVLGERYSAISHKWGEHVWLMVKVNDNWYHVDGLFGGLFYNVIETTFMVPDSAIEKTHRWDKTVYPPCTNVQLLK